MRGLDFANFSVQGFSSSHNLYKVQIEETNKVQAYVLARLLPTEMTDEKDATPTYTCGLDVLVFEVVGVRRV